jgi:hypothetical protein
MKITINKIVATVMQPQYIKTACFLIVIVLMMANQLHAQTADPGLDPDAEVPLDGGLSLLVAAGVGYGAKKMKERKSREAK